MRFPIANLLLLGAAALAAPVEEVNRGAKPSQHDSLVTRGLVPLVSRAFAPVKPIVHPDPVAPAPHPVNPIDPVAPVTPNTPGGLRPQEPVTPLNPDEPNAPALRPEDPATAPKPNESNLPGLRPQEPRPRPVPGNGCLKRNGCTPLPGAREDLAIDTKYNQVQNAVNPNEVPTGKYTSTDPEKPAGQWYTSIIDNSIASKTKFETEVAPQYKENLKNAGLSDKEATSFVDSQLKLFGKEGVIENGMSKSHENPKRGEITVEDIRNAEYDLYREYSGKTRVGMGGGRREIDYTRPAIDKNHQEVGNRKMLADNYRVASFAEGVPVTGLREINVHNIVTPEAIAILKKHMPPGKKEYTAKPDDENFKESFKDTTDNVVQAVQWNKIFAEEADFAGLKVVAYDVWLTETRKGRPVRIEERWDRRYTVTIYRSRVEAGLWELNGMRERFAQCKGHWEASETLTVLL